MKEKIYLGGISESAKEEISFLYSLGVEIEELEFMIKVKLKENLILNPS